MAKPGARSTSTPNMAGNSGGGGQQASTHPNTRVTDASLAGQKGAVKPTMQPIPDIKAAEANRQKGQSPLVPVNLATVGSATTEAEQRHQPTPVTPDVAVNTKH